MNCLEFRRRLRDHPSVQDVEVQSHKRECARCAAFAVELAALEERLGQAIRLPVPPGMAERLGLDHILRRARRRQQFAIAATLSAMALGGVLAVSMIWPSSLEAVVVEHIENEPQHLIERRVVSVAELRELLQMVGVSLRGELGDIRYAGLCKMRRGLGAHLVVAGRHGPVTLLVMPHETSDGARSVRRGGLRGVIVPAGNGSVAIVGVPDEPLEVIQERVSAALGA